MTADRITFRTVRDRIAALAAVGALGLGASLAFASAPAQAQPKQGAGAAGACEIEIDGKTTTVPSGTRVGLFVCGDDGEWHFGWLINAATITAPPRQTVKPIIAVASARSVHLPAVQSELLPAV